MVKLYKNFNIKNSHKNSLILIGNFDGVHLGHQKLFKIARKYKLRKKLKLGVITFDPIPKMFFNPKFKNYRISNFNQKIDQNEVSLHDIKLIDHTYENKFTSDLSKSRSYCLGFDALLVSYAIANNVKGELRGLLGIYQITSDELISKSYIN